jgi:hypothetical protein
MATESKRISKGYLSYEQTCATIRVGPRIVAVTIVLAIYGLARLPDISEVERNGLAGRFAFSISRFLS